MAQSKIVPFLAGMALMLAAVPASAERADGAPPTPFADRQQAWQQHQQLDAETMFDGLEWRSIGPVVQGGRVVDLEVVPGKPYSFLAAYASGGVWRTDNNGVTFEPIFDDQPNMIIGDIAIDPQQPETIWVGTGENNSSRSSYSGFGVFRSDDGGESWRHMGLGDSDRIGRILVDPNDSNRVYVGVLGKLYTPGGERGLYRTVDGGVSWQRVLATGDDDGWTGIIDLAMDPRDSGVLYAAAWHRERRPWEFVESGAGSGIYKSTDGGDNWQRLEAGLPSGEHVGRIGLALAASQPDTLYASVDNQEQLPEELWDLGDGAVTAKRLRKMTKEDFLAQDPEAIEDFVRANDLDTAVDAESLIEMVKSDELTLEGILAELDDANANLFNTDIKGLEIYRSDDGGASWQRTHEEPLREVVYTYGYYFGQIRVSPQDPDVVYAHGVPIIKSDDGGKTFFSIQDPDVHVDYQSQWIDEEHPEHTVVGNDGGIDVTYDGGASWMKLDRQSVGQFYTVAVDMEEPYNVYGGLQDNGTFKGSSKSKPGRDLWQRVGGGDGMHVQIDPRDGTTYIGFQFGFYTRIDPDGSRHELRPRDKLREPALRYNWSTPVLMSSHNSDILYYGADQVYRTMDKGNTWTSISPDLTRTQERGDVPFGTLTSLSESTLKFGLLWAGSDDGQLWLSRNGGAEWVDVAEGLPRLRWVTRVEASNHDENRAYVSLNGYRNDDMTPYVFVTDDLGATWRSIASNLPAEPVNVVREDPVTPEVLYVGTDRGVYTSLDSGATWQALPAGMPNVPVHDVVIHPRDRELVAATHGRSIFVLDALPIQELSAVKEQAVHVFPVEDQQVDRAWRSRRSPWFYRAEDDPKVSVPLWSAKAGEAKLTVLDADGRALRHLTMPVERGVHAFSWDLLLDRDLALDAERQRLAASTDGDKTKKAKRKQAKETAADIKPADQPWAEAERLGWPLYATAGEYTLRVTVGEATSETSFEMKPAEAREPRMQPEQPIRGRDKEDDL